MAINTKHIKELADQISNTDDCEALRLLTEQHLKSINDLIRSTVQMQSNELSKFLPLLSIPGANPFKIVKWIKKQVVAQALPQIKAYTQYAKDLIELAAAVDQIAGAVSQSKGRMDQCRLELLASARESIEGTIRAEVDAALETVLAEIGTTQAELSTALNIAPTINVSSPQEFLSSVDLGIQLINDSAGLVLAGQLITAILPPSITGGSIVGEVLTAAPGEWAGADSATYEYQWYRVSGGVSYQIDEATASTYTTTSFDEGSTIKCSVQVDTLTDSEQANTAAFGPITAPVEVLG